MNIIREKRMQQGITQEKLANMLDVDRSTIAKWESGQSLPRSGVLTRLSIVFECTVDELLKGGPNEREGTRITQNL